MEENLMEVKTLRYHFQPEGMLLATPRNKEFLASCAGVERALREGVTLEAPVLLCDAQMRLHVDLECMRGYIERERELAEKSNRLENIRIKGKFNYSELQSLSTEARQKLTAIDPDTLAQASRIPGVSPSDINVLLILAQR